MIKGLSKYLALACLISTCPAPAVQVDDLNLALTRSDADQTLSKDYNFTILADSTVRRQWRSNGRRLSMDFDINSEDAICIRITYDTAVSREAALEDVAKITRGQADPKGWKTTKKGAGENVGITGKSQFQKMADGSIIFWEWKNNKCVRVTYFARTPNTNRWAIGEMPTSSGKTLMGSSSTASEGMAKRLIADEQRRKDIKPSAPVAAKPTPKPKPAEPKPEKPDKPVAAVTPAPKPAGPAPDKPAVTAASDKPAGPARPAPARQKQSGGEETVVVEYSGFWGFWAGVWQDFQNVRDEAQKSDWVIAFKEKGTPSLLGVLGAILLILALIIWAIVAKIRSKARAKANYERILNNKPSNKAARKGGTETPQDETVDKTEDGKPSAPPPPPAK